MGPVLSNVASPSTVPYCIATSSATVAAHCTVWVTLKSLTGHHTSELTLYVQDKLHLYFLFDLMPGGDLMDVLVAEARVIKRRIAQGTWKRACFAPKVRRPVPACGHPNKHALGHLLCPGVKGLCERVL